jgi:hypothetical protein
VKEIKIHNKKKIKQKTIPNQFSVVKHGSLSLVSPGKNNKVSWDNNRCFRSLVYDRNQEIVSVGLPKFFDYDQDQAYCLLADQLIREEGEETSVTIKLDGSLIIRSVVKNKVLFRTRTKIYNDHLIDQAKEIAAEQYPELLNPEFASDLSLQFELISGKRKIVIAYQEEDLILIGATINKTLELLSYQENSELARKANLKLASEFKESFSSVQDLADKVKDRQDIEGLVLRFDKQQKMLRIKTDYYKLVHQAKYKYHFNKIWLFRKQNKFTDFKSLTNYLQVNDSATKDYLRNVYSEIIIIEEQINLRLEIIKKLVTENQGLTNKHFKQMMQKELPVDEYPVAIALRKKQEDQANKLIETSCLKTVDPLQLANDQ